MLTAPFKDTDKIIGLKLGADNYATKSFNAREVVTRIKALLCGQRLDQLPAAAPRMLVSSGLRLDGEYRPLSANGKRVELIRTEFNMLEVFWTNPGYTITRYGSEFFYAESSVWIIIAWLETTGNKQREGSLARVHHEKKPALSASHPGALHCRGTNLSVPG